MNIFVMVYLGGVGLKTLLTFAGKDRNGAVNVNFNDIVLWPLILLFDAFMFTMGLFEKH